MPYVPSNPPQVSTPDGQALASYLSNELQALASSMVSNVVSVPLSPVFVAPAKPRTGFVVYADGVKWNPGKGEGLYVFGSDSAWHWLDFDITLPLSVANGGTGNSGGAWTSYTIVVTTGTGTATGVGFFEQIGKKVFLSAVITFTSTVSGTVSFNLPVNAKRQEVIMTKEVLINGHVCSMQTLASSLTALIFDETVLNTPTVNGMVIPFVGVYEAA